EAQCLNENCPRRVRRGRGVAAPSRGRTREARACRAVRQALRRNVDQEDVGEISRVSNIDTAILLGRPLKACSPTKIWTNVPVAPPTRTVVFIGGAFRTYLPGSEGRVACEERPATKPMMRGYPWTLTAASRITSYTRWGWESIGTWLDA